MRIIRTLFIAAVAISALFAVALTSGAGARHAAKPTPKCHGHEATIVGTKGDDGSANHPFKGTKGPDVIVTSTGNDIIDPGKGNDIICSGGGNDVLLPSNGSDKAYGGSGKDVMYGGKANDLLKGDSGSDLFDGGSGKHDVCSGGSGHDLANAKTCESIHGADAVQPPKR